MKKFYLVLPLLVLFLLPTSLYVTGAEAENPYRLMVVDGTRSLEISMRIQGLVSALKKREGLEVDAQTLKTEDPTLNPLKGMEVEPYDLVMIVPPTIETGSIEQVWLVTRPLSQIPLEQKKGAMAQLDQLKEAVLKAFEGKVTPVGVNDDLIPAYFSTLFLREGALR
ncbi:hypothetical protein KGY71_03910 [Candidatus Bipolaricaulota bacterium]|nr:hypothetical protein [Candidatus Bipolaricaulota bacterium]